ncbi:hypothetical protein I4F81_007076 [Pyropia yezoensis]|uniref:Uncharacterized protein n=1 Tax=Pyropia yezoensis TaxID=2788 RepID=A0ACC3C3H8_PYRYE|nr:hypothetical protein I4F81_007076 [Neopyropia yezoensis]
MPACGEGAREVGGAGGGRAAHAFRAQPPAAAALPADAAAPTVVAPLTQRPPPSPPLIAVLRPSPLPAAVLDGPCRWDWRPPRRTTRGRNRDHDRRLYRRRCPLAGKSEWKRPLEGAQWSGGEARLRCGSALTPTAAASASVAWS